MKARSRRSRLGLLDEAGLDGLDRDPKALRAAVRQLDADPLQIRTEFALRDAGHVRADAAALLGLTLAVDDRALDGTATGDCTDSGHDGFELIKGSEEKGRAGAKQGDFSTWNLIAPGMQHLEFLAEMSGMQKLQQGQLFPAEMCRFGRGRCLDKARGMTHEKRFL